MNGFYRFLLILCLFVSASTALSAQEIVLRSDTLTVYFRVGSHEYDPDYMGNGERMNSFTDKFTIQSREQGSFHIQEMDFVVSSSPEGSYEANKGLSQRRAKTIEQYLKTHADVIDSVLVISHVAEAWDELVSVLEASDEPWRDEVLDIIRNTPQLGTDSNGNVTEPRKQKVMAYRNGAPWRYMIQKWFPEMRHFTILLKSGLELPVFSDVEIEDFDIPFEELVVDDYRPVVALMPTWASDFTIKTNGIGWGMGHSNVALEIDLAPHWSLTVPFYYSGGFDYFTSGIKFRGIVVQPEARYYFKGNDGWYLGLHAGAGWYNFALNGDYRIQDHNGNRPAWGGGLGFGYQLQFKKNPRWGMEFALGAGVYDAKYDTFYNEENGPIAQSGVRTLFIGVDNATVGVTYKIISKGKEGRK